MKKIFLVLAVASLGFVSCNDSASDKPAEDVTPVETPKVETPAMDTTAHVDTTAVPVDTTAAAK